MSLLCYIGMDGDIEAQRAYLCGVEPDLLKYSYGCVMFDIDPQSEAGQQLRALRDEIPDEDLMAKGREGEPHVTVRYGIQDTASEAGIAAYLTTQEPFTIALGPVMVFPPSPQSGDAAVVVVQVISPELERINEELAAAGNFKQADFDYHPHITIAYVATEAAEKWAGEDSVEGLEIEVDTITIRSKDGAATPVALAGHEEDEGAAPAAVPSGLNWTCPDCWNEVLAEVAICPWCYPTAAGEILAEIEKLAKANPNHDPSNGEFASGIGPVKVGLLDESLIGDGMYGGSSMSRLPLASIKRLAEKHGIDPVPYLRIKDGPAGTRTGRNKLESAILHVNRSAREAAEKLAKFNPNHDELGRFTEGLAPFKDHTSKRVQVNQPGHPMHGKVGTVLRQIGNESAVDIKGEENAHWIPTNNLLGESALKGVFLCGVGVPEMVEITGDDHAHWMLQLGRNSNAPILPLAEKATPMRGARVTCPKCGRYLPAGSQTCESCSSPGTGPEITSPTEGIESTPDDSNPTSQTGNLPTPSDIGIKQTDDPLGSAESGANQVGVGPKDNAMAAAADRSEDPYGTGPSTPQKVLLCSVEKANPNHDELGRFAEGLTVTVPGKSNKGRQIPLRSIAEIAEEPTEDEIHIAYNVFNGGRKVPLARQDHLSYKDVAELVHTAHLHPDWQTLKVEEIGDLIKSASVLEKFNDNHAADGRFDFGSNVGVHETGLTLKRTKTRAFNGKQVKTKLTPHELPSKDSTGKLGQSIIIKHLQMNGFSDARPLIVKGAGNHYPIDVVQNHDAIEIKSGLVTNSEKAQQWRITFSTSAAEKQRFQSWSKEKIRDYNVGKQNDAFKRKIKALKELATASGGKMSGKTMAALINPETKTADVFSFPGFHQRIGWSSDTMKKGYVASYTY